jgi:hypothetical protein
MGPDDVRRSWLSKLSAGCAPKGISQVIDLLSLDHATGSLLFLRQLVTTNMVSETGESGRRIFGIPYRG